MKKLNIGVIFAVVTAAFLVLAFFAIRKPSSTVSKPADTSLGVSAESDVETADVKIDSGLVPNEGATDANEKSLASVIELTSGNFASFVERCFQGEPCAFGEDPKKMYDAFKLRGDRQTSDLLLSLMRRNLKNDSFREQYKDNLKSMIEDFYSPEELPFQEAAYYNYLGDLKKSLELYLALERKSEFDMSLRPAPKLNIANTYYDLGRFREALRYYEAALQEKYENETLRFIDDRITEIRSKLRI